MRPKTLVRKVWTNETGYNSKELLRYLLDEINDLTEMVTIKSQDKDLVKTTSYIESYFTALWEIMNPEFNDSYETLERIVLDLEVLVSDFYDEDLWQYHTKDLNTDDYFNDYGNYLISFVERLICDYRTLSEYNDKNQELIEKLVAENKKLKIKKDKSNK